ncbi:RNA-directed DNA polymerase, eukaryota, reverse transcriptase zinc-binding domain protein [Tanacetum coccineum]|uniref:RNA-directed DNA polymerase, eukaryota, reverse transcriptase zinc-binding domain protein n=1 Tax=Tanacetum coccineum TaxID=301880 RepID=A0ABQ5GRW6_9ASTR
MESLHVSFQRVVDAGMFNGISLDPSLHLSHMFYADDVIFVGQWSEFNINTIVHVLDCFHRASGLRINMRKSKLLGIFVDADKVDQAMVEGMANRLSRWKMKTLSIGVLQRMESIRAHFYDGVELGSKKPIWVKWKNVLASKHKGGLRVSSLFALNRALMFKWVWRFFSQSFSLWARVVKAIHGGDGKIGKKAKSTFSSLWLDIVHEVELLKDRCIDLISFIHKKLGNGADTLFWEDAWRGGTAFKYLYPRVYALESNKNINVASKMAHCNLGYSFRRDPRGDVEKAQFDSMFEKVEGTLLADMRDRWTWSLEGSGDFSVASVRKLLDENMLPEVASKTWWIKAMPNKVNVDAWRVKLDCLTTRIIIFRRGMEIESIICPMCGEAAESSRHIFFSCHIAKEILHKISRWWDVSYMELSSYEEWLDWIFNIRISVKHKQILEGIDMTEQIKVWFLREVASEDCFAEDLRDQCSQVRANMEKRVQMMLELDRLGGRGATLK